KPDGIFGKDRSRLALRLSEREEISRGQCQSKLA
ncbi:unnamed protein product, partial [marine sediment metagenome]